MNLTSISARIDNEDVSWKICKLFHRIMMYNSKIEEIKNLMFERNPEFDLLGVINIYDDNQDGSID